MDRPDTVDMSSEQAAFMCWARMYFGPRAEEHLARSGLHFLTPQTVAMFDAWQAAASLEWVPVDLLVVELARRQSKAE